MQHCADEIKAILANSTGTPTRKAIALLAAIGVTKTAEVAAILGITDRAVRKAKAEPQFRNDEPEFRNHSSESGTTVPEPEFRSKKKSPHTPKEKTTSLPRTTLNVQQLDAREPALGPTEQYRACKAEFNGSTEWMLGEIEEAVPTAGRDFAIEWLFNSTTLHGADAMRGAFQQLASHKLQRMPINRRIGFLSKTAASLKAKSEAAKTADVDAERAAYRKQCEAIAGVSL